MHHSPLRLNFRWFTSMILALLLAPNAQASSDLQPILVFASGYDRCQNSWEALDVAMRRPFAEIKQNTARSLGLSSSEIPWVASCYLTVNRRQSRLVMQSSPQVSGGSLAAKVVNIAARRNMPPVVIIVGYSWGGMLAIESTVQIRQQLNAASRRPGFEALAQAKIMLVTIDPIDYRYCHQPILSTIGNGNCRQAPRRMISQAIQATNQWNNFYQVEGSLLSSGPIGGLGAGANRRQSYPQVMLRHLAILQDQSTWYMVAQSIAGFLR